MPSRDGYMRRSLAQSSAAAGRDARKRRNCERGAGRGHMRQPADGEAAGCPRDLCTLARAQPVRPAAGGTRRLDPQPRWHL